MSEVITSNKPHYYHHTYHAILNITTEVKQHTATTNTRLPSLPYNRTHHHTTTTDHRPSPATGPTTTLQGGPRLMLGIYQCPSLGCNTRYLEGYLATPSRGQLQGTTVRRRRRRRCGGVGGEEGGKDKD